jgi:hypothetical protein
VALGALALLQRQRQFKQHIAADWLLYSVQLIVILASTWPRNHHPSRAQAFPRQLIFMSFWLDACNASATKPVQQLQSNAKASCGITVSPSQFDIQRSSRHRHCFAHYYMFNIYI